jgi:hypothetical protein
MIGRFGYLLVLAMSLFGCGDLKGASYGLDRGVASYDGLKAATATCEAKGGALRLRKGFEGRDLSDYDCAIGKAR